MASDSNPEIGDWVLWSNVGGSVDAEVLGYDGPTGTWLLRTAHGTIGWVRAGDFEWSGPRG
jgi:hypothetical protein